MVRVDVPKLLESAGYIDGVGVSGPVDVTGEKPALVGSAGPMAVKSPSDVALWSALGNADSVPIAMLAPDPGAGIDVLNKPGVPIDMIGEKPALRTAGITARLNPVDMAL